MTKPKQPASSDWQSTVGAASEEWVDSTQFAFSPGILQGRTVAELVDMIIGGIRAQPDQEVLLSRIAEEFGLPESEPIRAVDRVLGGIVRAASKNPAARPSAETDPVGAIAFDRASADKGIIDDVFPGWRDWPPGEHSVPLGGQAPDIEEAGQGGGRDPGHGSP